ncbi:MAG: Ig-like domain-containing protein [bacterium]
MNKMKYSSKMWLIPLLLVMIMAGCDERVGITAPPLTTTPTVSSANPANMSTGVALNQKITATFSEVMKASTITTASFTLMQGTSFVSGTVSYTGTTATFAPSSNLMPNTTYIATITTLAKNNVGNSLETNYVWSFTTGLTAADVPPTVTSTDPVNAVINVAINQKISATFSMAMDASTITASTFTLTQGDNPISGFVSYSGTTALFAPSINLMPNTVYTVTINTGAKSLTGIPFENDYVWSFTTGADVVVTPPTIISTNPVIAGTDVDLNQKITATFSKTMDATTITTATFTLMQGTSFVSGTVSYTGTTATFTPLNNLLPSTTYTATITTGAKDLAGNTIASNYVWNFITGASVIITPPTIILTDPFNNETGVALNQKIATTFSKTMDVSTITTTTYILKHGATSVLGFVSYSGMIGAFSPTANLLPNTVYTVTITTGTKDLAGNSIAANYEWNFTTGEAIVVTPPTVVSTNPVDFATNVALNQKISTTFSKTMDAATITDVTYTLKFGTTSVSGFVTYSGKTAIFTPTNNLLPNTIYTVTINTQAKDLSGIALTNNYVWSFTTVFPNVLTLLSSPAAGGTTIGGGTFNSGTSVTVTAAANNGFSFTNWTKNDVIVSSNASYTFILNGNITLTANFTPTGPIIFLGAAATFGGFGGTAGLTNQGIFSVVNGDIGTTAASTLVTGFHDTGGNVYTETPLNIGTVNGTIFCAPPAPGTDVNFAKAQQAWADANAAFNYLAGLPEGPDPGAGELGGLVLAPGTYTAASGTFKITSSDLTLDAQNNPNAVFVFQIAQSLTVGSPGLPRSIILINGAKAKNVYWQVGSAATINGTGGGTMVGTIIAYSGVTFSTSGNVILTILNGRALSLNASVTIVNTIVNIPL